MMILLAVRDGGARVFELGHAARGQGQASNSTSFPISREDVRRWHRATFGEAGICGHGSGVLHALARHWRHGGVRFRIGNDRAAHG